MAVPRTLRITKLMDLVKHGVDTAKYYQQAERELEAERVSGGR